jgi:hypothetical protein
VSKLDKLREKLAKIEMKMAKSKDRSGAEWNAMLIKKQRIEHKLFYAKLAEEGRA